MPKLMINRKNIFRFQVQAQMCVKRKNCSFPEDCQYERKTYSLHLSNTPKKTKCTRNADSSTVNKLTSPDPVKRTGSSSGYHGYRGGRDIFR